MTKAKKTTERFRLPKYCKMCGRRLYSHISRMVGQCAFCDNKKADI